MRADRVIFALCCLALPAMLIGAWWWQRDLGGDNAGTIATLPTTTLVPPTTALAPTTPPTTTIPPIELRVQGDPSSEPDGEPTQLSDGTPVTVFGVSPIYVFDGAYTHTLSPGVSAGYLQADVGKQVDRIGMSFRWDPGETGTVAVVVPFTEWFYPGGLSSTGLHLTVTHEGVHTIGRYNANTQTVEVYESVTTPRLDDGQVRSIDVSRDPADPATVIVTMANGQRMRATDQRLVTETGIHAVWELFHPSSDGQAPGWIHAVWAG